MTLSWGWRRSPCGAVTFALCLVARPSVPADECAVRLFPPGASDAWRKAAMDLEQRVRTLPRASSDCGEITVEATLERASVVFVTRDGRRATREVTAPSELVPTVEALLVTMPPPAPAEPPRAAAPSPPPVAEKPAAPAPQHETRAMALIVGAGGGARFGLPGSYASPELLAMLGATIARWDFGLRAQGDVVHTTFGTSLPSGFRLSSYVLAASVGRRQPLGFSSIVFGATLGASFLSWSVPDTSQGEQQGQNSGDNSSPGSSGSRVEPRCGLYLGAALPRESWIRFRPELTTDVVVSRLGSGFVIDSSVPPLAWWSAAAALGLEGELP